MAIFNGNKEFSKKRELYPAFDSSTQERASGIQHRKAYANGGVQLET